MKTDSREDDALDEGYLVRLNGHAWGAALGVLCGLGLFLATVVLVIKGGQDVGSHLGLLSQYLPYYDVDWTGAFMGFGYGALLGYALGRLVCGVYNATAKR